MLPYRFNGLYQRRSLKMKARELVERFPHGLPADEAAFDAGDSLWTEINQLFRAVAEGNTEWGVPEYDGDLFSRDPEVSPTGALLETVTLPNTVLGLALWHVLVINTPEGWGPVDFRSLSVREFGTVYEGLLESELSVAEVDLTTDREGYYRPCQAGETPEVKKSRVYLHNRSGARKATGTYFTKEFAVDHLLDHALEPALVDHLARLDGLDDTDAAEGFFDFRVADIAMGSGHFLVAAVDRIERAFTGYLAKRSLPGVRAELGRLRESALDKLGKLAEALEIEDTQLLRRLIARRCIYGVDLNPIAVNLARLSIWIHTFVPGLPLSLLDHNLVAGNSLVGIGRLSEIEEKAKEDAIDPRSKHQLLMFMLDATTLLGPALEPLQQLAHIADLTAAEVRRARQIMKKARDAVRPAEALCDIVWACRTQRKLLSIEVGDWDALKDSLFGSAVHVAAIGVSREMSRFHFPIAFPEVFLRDPHGFDVIIGNPPWEKVRVEEHEYWARHFPGLRGLQRADRDRTIATLKCQRGDLLAAWEIERAETELVRDAVRDMPGMNTGHPDLFRAFIWRFIQLVRPGIGRLGIVLPGDTFKINGAAELREHLAEACGMVRVQMLTNKGEWVFEDVDGRKLISFVTVSTKKIGESTVFHIPQEHHTKKSWDNRDLAGHVACPLEVLREYSQTLVVPLLPATSSFDVIKQFLSAPRMALHPTLRVRRVYADFETTRDRSRYHEAEEPGDWPVYKGESFDIWQPDTGRYYGFTNGENILQAAQQRRLRAPRGTPYFETPEAWRTNVRTHPVNFPRIAFRDVTNRTNRRTFVTALIPGNVVNVQVAPWVLWLDPSHPIADEAFLIGVLSTVPLDWWARRFVEGHVDQEAFNSLRIPEPQRHKGLAGRTIALAGRLAALDERFANWAQEVGVECGPLPEAQKRDHVNELDAVVAHLYGLSEKHLVHIFETFHEGWDYEERLRETLKHYRHWKGKGA